MKFKAELLRAERGRRDWTKERLASEAELSVPTVRAVLRGDPSASYESVEKVTTALGLSITEIIDAAGATAPAAS